MRPRRKASGTARGEGLCGPAPLDSPPDAKAEPWNHHAAMTSPQGVPIRPGTPPRKTDGTGAPASVTHAVRLTAPDAMGPWTRFARGSDSAFPLRAPSARSTGCRLRPPTVGYGRGTELAQPLAPFEFSFEPFACGKDRNRLNARATRCRTPRGSACSRTLRRPALSLDQTVQKKKFRTETIQ